VKLSDVITTQVHGSALLVALVVTRYERKVMASLCGELRSHTSLDMSHRDAGFSPPQHMTPRKGERTHP